MFFKDVVLDGKVLLMRLICWRKKKFFLALCEKVFCEKVFVKSFFVKERVLQVVWYFDKLLARCLLRGTSCF